jgi:hypothetical protein
VKREEKSIFLPYTHRERYVMYKHTAAADAGHSISLVGQSGKKGESEKHGGGRKSE